MIRSSSPAAKPAFLALAAVSFIASAPAHAADDKTAVVADDKNKAAAADEQDQDKIVVTGAEQRRQENPKVTRPVRDTPQTVTVLDAETIEKQNLLTLRDVLMTVPGVTFGAAEGGTAPSDQITFRGYSATSDITQDGVRDSAVYSRSDSFNLDQVEITNGANSVYSGAGSVGGSINIVTKRPLSEDRVIVSGGVGTSEYYRATVDANKRVADNIALRVNAMYHRNDVPGRDVEYNKRWGVAPSVTLGIGGPTRLTLQYLHQEDDNIPLYGVPYIISATNQGPIAGVDRSSYYGYRNIDRQNINLDQATLIFDHELSEKVSIRNLARWQNTSQLTIANPPQGTFCLSNGLQANGAACPANVPAGYYLPSGPRGTYRFTDNDLMYNQLDLRAVANTGAIEHTIVLGGSFGYEKFSLFSGNIQRTAAGVAPAYPLMNIANPNIQITGPGLPAGTTYGSNVYTGPINLVATLGQRGEVENYALYAFDTMKLGNFELNGGVRWESNNGTYIATPTSTPINTDAKLFSYRIGAVYKPVKEVSLYAAFGNSETPSQTAVNGTCTIAGINGATVTSCVTKPETAKNYEIGAKAELFNAKLLLTLAAFRNERDSYRLPSNDPTLPDQQLDGHSRVDGIAVGAVGKITKDWTINANYTYLKPKLIQSVSDYCLANIGATGCANTTAYPDPAAGAELQNTPKHSGSLFTTYTLPFGLTLGYGVSYQGDFALNLPTATARTVLRSQEYWVHSAYVSYKVSDKLSAQLNVKNLTDATYFTGIRNNGTTGWALPGAGRAGVLSLTYAF